MISISPKTQIVERVERIELSRYPWQGHKLPLHHTRILAESIGIEPIHRLPSDRLAICCLTARPTLRNLLPGGECGIRTHGPLTADSFQDCFLKPSSDNSP